MYCLTLTAWQWLMSFICIPVQDEPNKSPWRKRLLVLLLWEIGHLSSPSRSCLGRLILICANREWGGLCRRSPPYTLPLHMGETPSRSSEEQSEQLRGSFACRAPPSAAMRISLPRHDLLGEERWPISQKRRAKSLFLHGLLLGSFCTGIQIKLINHCQPVRVKQWITHRELWGLILS